MALLLISTHRFIIFIILIQSVSLYKIYAPDDINSNSFSDLSLSSLKRHLSSDNSEDENLMSNQENENIRQDWLPLLLQDINENQENSFNKRSFFSSGSQSLKPVQQRRNNRPHWNPLVAAYRRCGELSRREERESCFKDAIQMLFVHKLRK